jgi:hypothetical protein
MIDISFVVPSDTRVDSPPALMSAEAKNSSAGRFEQGRRSWRITYRVAVLVLAFQVAYITAEQVGGGQQATVPPSDSSGRDWYRALPGDANPDGALPLAPLIVERPLVPIPAEVRNLAIAKLTNTEVAKLTREDCRTLGVPFEADQLLDKAIKEDAMHVKQGLRYMKMHPMDGSSSDATYKSIERGIAEHKAQIAHWKNLRGRVDAYLVRAVAANYVDQEFYAAFWRHSVIVTHRSVINKSANDPLHQYASMGNIELAEMVKWPVVVYLESPPANVYSRVHVLKLGR